ncbi:MAG: nuclear transport factor 2 family protein [Halieaceae bacterium]|nr:nuclear transport factor 2 family protein [Halieaceae bacterium]
MTALKRWHEVVKSKDPNLLDDLLAEDCVFYSPIVHTPQEGRDLTKMYLASAMQVLGEGFHYVREVVDGNQAVLEFMGENEGITINGVDIFTWNEEGKIDSFKVMVRPLKAVHLLHAQMQAMLEQWNAAARQTGNASS